MVNTILVQLLTFALFLFMPSMLFAEGNRWILYGEQESKDYAKPVDLVEKHQNVPYLLESVSQNDPGQQLEQFLKEDFVTQTIGKLKDAMECTPSEYADNYSTYRYLFRLITLSQIYEAMDYYNYKGKLKKEVTTLMQNCRTKSADMKKLISFAQVNLDFDFQDRDLDKSITEKALVLKDANWTKLYEREAKLFELVCSEEDDLWGQSNTTEPYYFLATSHALRLINKEGHGQNCLKKFSELNSSHEKIVPELKDIYPYSFYITQERFKGRYPQGRLFLWGSLQEYEEKGLIKVVDKPVIAAVTNSQVPVTQNTVKVQEVLPAKVDIKKVEEIINKEPELTKIFKSNLPAKSAFLVAAEDRESVNKEKVRVDMERFKLDYPFSISEIFDLNQSIKPFASQSALKEMQEYDKLGTIEGTLPLIFLKYLIDTQNHQGLWNIVNVLGKRIFVMNDIDHDYPTKPELVEISFEETPKPHWQLSILRQ